MNNSPLPLSSLDTQNFPMDISSSGLEKSQNVIILGDDFAQKFQTKSFRCSFCKRGFSNAQALGGHMNIHRKDRAKLREFSDENLLSLEISTAGDCDENDHQSRDDEDQAEKLNRLNGVPPLRLPLSVEEVAPEEGGGGGGERGERRKEELKYGEVDLELRLGPEPHHHAKSKP